MKKIFVDNISTDNTLVGDDHHHLSVVLRAKVGDEVTLCDGDGFDYLYKIVGIDKSSTRLNLISKTKVETEPTNRVDLFVALLKSDKLEWVCQKCTELGVSGIYPFVSDFVQVKGDSLRLDRLNKIIKEAVQQSGRGKLPTLSTALSFKEMTDKLGEYDNVLFLYEKGGVPLKDAMKRTGSTAVIVGSEGGFSDGESDSLVSLGLRPISLGKRILRAETACVTAVALALYELGELQ